MIYTHAPDGGMVCGALCEDPAGDVTQYEFYVTCPECLDALEVTEIPFGQLARHVREMRSAPFGRVTQRTR